MVFAIRNHHQREIGRRHPQKGAPQATGNRRLEKTRLHCFQGEYRTHNHLMLRGVLVASMLTAALLVAAQDKEKQPAWAINFEDYAVKDVFTRKPKSPVFTSTAAASLMDDAPAINEAARKGPNFAGHYTIIELGCGAGCVRFFIADAANGVTFPTPVGSPLTLPLRAGGKGRNYQGLVYQRQSRLLIVDGCPRTRPHEKNRGCGTYYYEFKGGKWKLIRLDTVVT